MRLQCQLLGGRDGPSPVVLSVAFGSNAIAGETNALLVLTNVGFAQGGSYSVVLSNAYGSATGGPAVLTVVDTIPPIFYPAPPTSLSRLAGTAGPVCQT